MVGALHLPSILLVKLAWKRVVGAAAAAAVAVGGIGYGVSKDIGGGGGGGGGGSDTANLWVDLSGGTCTRSTTPAAYSDSAACSTVDAAYQAATDSSPCDTIRVKGGTYTNQATIEIDYGKTSATCDTVVRPAEGENVTFAQNFGILGSNLHFIGNGTRFQKGGQNFIIYNLSLTFSPDGDATDADWGRSSVFEGLQVRSFQITNQDFITIRNTEVGPNLFCYGASETRETGDGPETICPTDPPYWPSYPNGNNDGGSNTTTVTDEPKIGPYGGTYWTNKWPNDITLDGLYFHDHPRARTPATVTLLPIMAAYF